MAEQRVSLPSGQIYDLSNFEYHLTRILESGKSQVCLFLSGKTGVEKSHLTNALIGKEVAEEGDSLDPMSMVAEPYETDMNGVHITAWDTPGMADGSQREQAYLMSMMTKIKDVDLFLYCAEMNTQRVRNDDIKCIQSLTKAFGHRLWKNALIVLTFANEVHPKGRKVSDDKYFMERLRKFKLKYYRVLEEAGIPELMVHMIPVVPAGELSEPELPDRDNWITALWIQAFKRMAEDAKPAMFLANVHRMGLVDPGSVEVDDSAVLDEFFSANTVTRPRQVELSPEERRRISEARQSFQSSAEGSPTPDRWSPTNGGRKRGERVFTYGTRDEDSSERKTSEGDPFDPERDSLAESEALAANEADTSQPLAGRNGSGGSASSSVESDKHKKTGSDEETEIQQNPERTVPLRMSKDSILEVIGEVSKEMREDGQYYAVAGQMISTWFIPGFEGVGSLGGYVVGTVIKLIRNICEKVAMGKKQCPNETFTPQ